MDKHREDGDDVLPRELVPEAADKLDASSFQNGAVLVIQVFELGEDLVVEEINHARCHDRAVDFGDTVSAFLADGNTHE